MFNFVRILVDYQLIYRRGLKSGSFATSTPLFEINKRASRGDNMKVKELIDELKKYNLESNVEINLTDGSCLPIQKIEQDQMEEFSNEYLYLITEGELKQQARKK